MFDWFRKEEGMINHLEIDEGVIEVEETSGDGGGDRRAREDRLSGVTMRKWKWQAKIEG